MTVLAVALAAPITIAVLHPGYPLDDVDLTARDVWVSNTQQALAGRLNVQIHELNGSVSASKDTDILQGGDDVFIHDNKRDSLLRIDPAFTRLEEKVKLPAGATVAYGNQRLSVLSPDRGALWLVDGSQALRFDASVKPAAELGSGSKAIVAQDGSVFGYSTDAGAIVKIDPSGGPVTELAKATVEDYELTTVGDRVVILDHRNNVLIFDDGRRVDGFAETVLRIQQPGPARNGVVVATNTSLLNVGFDGAITVLGTPGANGPAVPGSGVAAPVVVGTCTYSAWASAGQYFSVCDGAQPIQQSLGDRVDGQAVLEFRVNRSVVALNNLRTGAAWLLGEQFQKITTNWEEVKQPLTQQNQQSDPNVHQQSLEETLADRTEQNHPPVLEPDSLGARPGQTTILPVLDNDSDSDGDVLTITSVSDIGSSGKLTIIEDGRALQLEPAAGVSGTISFRYSVSDGRQGTAETQADVAVRPLSENSPPDVVRNVSVALEAGQTMTYNALRDWVDPDGDELIVTGAVSKTQDTVRFRPEGEITFTHVSAELGPKTIDVTVWDGHVSVIRSLIFDVKASGTLLPVGTPDFATAFTGHTVEISPLENDLSPSGEDLQVTAIQTLTPGVAPELNSQTGTVRMLGAAVGTYYLEYTVIAGAKEGHDVLADPDEPLPPIAVKDTGYLRPQESVTIPVLLNDLSPNGEVLGVQGFTLPIDSPLTVEILGGTVLRVTSSTTLTEPVSFEYTISDGRQPATAGVTIVPVPPLTIKHAPIAKDDVVTVRAGDIAGVSVLANDSHPDGVRMSLDTDLPQYDLGGGFAFVNGDQVRIQAPAVAGQYSVTYKVTDAFHESSTARIVVTVTKPESGDDRPPVAPPIEARVFAGSSVTIDVPLDGIDPDGDSVEFVGASGAAKGTVDAIGSTSFRYTALTTSRGTDTFFYRVRDALGQSSAGEIRIGVIPRTATFPPSAVLDEISVRPGRTTEIPVLANDSDPNGYQISVLPTLSEVSAGLEVAVVDNRLVTLTAPAEPGSYLFKYTITDGSGTSEAYVRVTVTEDAPILPPVAIDHVIQSDDVAGTRSTIVSVRDGASNPGGRTDELTVAVVGPGSDQLTVGADGTVTAPIGDDRRAFAYSLTNEVDHLTTYAFIVVPRYATAPAPRLKAQYETNPPILQSGEVGTWTLDQILDVPSGRPAIIIDADTAVALNSDGSPVVVNDTTLSYHPKSAYRGTSAITFTVTDGTSAEDRNGNIAVITLPLIVGDPNSFDVAPTFTETTVQIEPGESKVVNLRALSDHPNPDVIEQLTYTGFVDSSTVIAMSPGDGEVTVSAPDENSTGATAEITFKVAFQDRSIDAKINVVVVRSKRPLPQAVDDVVAEGRSNSTYAASVTDVLANDFNPYQSDSKPLTIVSA
ncbi:MAG: Ig-like domain-containing protein, partial [Pseudolysinimonas sp.]